MAMPEKVFTERTEQGSLDPESTDQVLNYSEEDAENYRKVHMKKQALKNLSEHNPTILSDCINALDSLESDIDATNNSCYFN